MSDIANRKYGKLTALKLVKRFPSGGSVWECVCECGRHTQVFRSNLMSGHSTSCGKCIKRKDITGQRFGRWYVKDLAFIKKVAYWNCVCDCGTERAVNGAMLRNGLSTSCGCYARERRLQGCTKHGLSYTIEYQRVEVKRRREQKKKLDTEWTPEMEYCIRQVFDTCVLCGISQEEHLSTWGTSLHIDHVAPLHKNNGLKPGNATVLCGICNTHKGYKDILDLPSTETLKIRLSADLFKLIWEDSSVRYSYLGEQYGRPVRN